jgi:hypothetical protein
LGGENNRRIQANSKLHKIIRWMLWNRQNINL